MREFMEGHVVEMIRALERIESGHRDKILAGHIVRFAVALADVGARGAQEFVGKLVARVRIASPRRLSCIDALGKVITLVDIENRIFTHHRD